MSPPGILAYRGCSECKHKHTEKCERCMWHPNLGNNFVQKQEKKEETVISLDVVARKVLGNELEYLLKHAPEPDNWSMPASKALLERLRQDG